MKLIWGISVKTLFDRFFETENVIKFLGIYNIKLKEILHMKKIFGLMLLFYFLLALGKSDSRATDWELPVKYDMSFPNLKAYRYGPMLGGIGTAGLSFNTMGLCNFTIFNYYLNEGCLDGSFFAVYVKTKDKKVVRFLQSYGRVAKEISMVETTKKFETGVGAEIGGEQGRRDKPEEVGEQLGLNYGQKMVSTALCYSLPPAVEMHYLDEELPCEISVTAFSPLIPHDYENSNLPAAGFIYHLKNPTKMHLEATIVFSFQNNLGWSDTKKYDKTFNKIFRENGITGVLLKQNSESIQEEHKGEIAIATLDKSGEVSYLQEWDTQGDGADLFNDFSSNGILSNSENSIESAKSKGGAIAVKINLAPGEVKDIPFFLGWYFPKMSLKDVDVTSFGTIKNGKEFHFNLDGWSQQFSKYIPDAKSLVLEASKSYLKWWDEIHRFHEKMASSGIPEWLVSRYFHDLTWIPRWTYWIHKEEENFFTVQEGQFGNGLCTSCVDGYNWFVLLWPKLELQEMKQLARAQWPSGESVQELAMSRGSHGHLEATWFTIRTYQDYVWTLDDEFLDFMWPYVKKTIQYTIENEYDAETGLTKVDYSGVNSYDSWRMDEFTAYGNSQWLISLKMAAKMAEIQNEFDKAKKYQNLFEKAQRSFIEKLWVNKGKYGYFKLCTGNVYDAETSHVEQLIGVYWGDHLNFKILPSNYTKTALNTIFNLNRMEQLGWVCGRFVDGRVPLWDRTVKPPSSKMQHSGRNRGTAQWQLASLLITQGRIEKGIETGEFIYNMESTRKETNLWTNPYYLCYFRENGDFGGYFPALYTSYPRMGSWGYYIACAGAVATEKGLYIKPRVQFNTEQQEYFVHWANAVVTIQTTGSGKKITSAKVNGKKWKNIDDEGRVFLPRIMGEREATEIKVEIKYE